MPNINQCAQKLDKIFFDYKSKNISDRDFCSQLESALKLTASCTGMKKEFEVAIIDGKSEFFGMRVYPDLEEFNKFIFKNSDSDGIKFCKSWIYDIEKYDIEIDKNMFDTSIISFNPQEMTAMILHELAHVAFNDKVSEKLYTSIKINRSLLKLNERKAVAKMQAVLYIIPALVACGMHQWNIGKNGIFEEYTADKIFGATEYSRHMSSALNKIIEAYGTTIVLSDSEQDGLIDTKVKWCNINIIDISHRRELIQRDIFMMAASSKSKYFKKACLNVLTRFGIGMHDKYSNALVATESIIAGIDSGDYQLSGILSKFEFDDTIPRQFGNYSSIVKNALESTITWSCANESSKNKIPSMPSDYDIDVISVDIDRIENHADRIYTLDLIHNRLDQLCEFEEYVEFNGTINRFKSKIASQKHQLEQMRTQVLNKKSLNKQYGVFVKYPSGYEG